MAKRIEQSDNFKEDPPRIGHNSGDTDTPGGPGSVEARHLLSFVERIERLAEDKKQVSEDIGDVYTEAKSTGYDIKIMRKLVAIRKLDADKRAEEDSVLSLYMTALGMA